MTKEPSLLLALSLAVAACALPARRASSFVATGARPSWIEGDGPEYPRASYITGVGSADDDATAADRARGEIARVFSTEVSVNTSVEESESNSGQGKAQSHSFSQNLAESVRTTAKKVLEGTEIVKRYKDSTGRYYALAVLPKDQALLAVEEKLHGLDAQSAAWTARLDQAPDRLGKAAAAAKLLALAKARESLEADRRVLGGGEEPGGELGSLKAKAAQALAALEVPVSASGEGAEELATGLVSGLNAAGLSAKLGAPGPDADIAVSASSSVAPLSVGGDPRWQWSRADATVELRDVRSGRVVSRFELTAREASASASQARRRALSGLAGEAAAKVRAALDEFFADQ